MYVGSQEKAQWHTWRNSPRDEKLALGELAPHTGLPPTGVDMERD